MKKIADVFVTTDYSMFKLIKGNRVVSLAHVERLKMSFQKKYLFSPIIVNSRNEIIDGQHRYMAAKALKLPIHYMIQDGYGIEEIKILNTNSKNWKAEDFLTAYCDMGYPEYLKFKQFKAAFPDFNFNSCLFLLGTRATTSKKVKANINKSNSLSHKTFQNGGLKIENYDDSVKRANLILELKPHRPKDFNKSILVAAMVKILKSPGYNHKRMIAAAIAWNKAGTEYRLGVDVGSYKAILEDIYNYRRKPEECVSFRYL